MTHNLEEAKKNLVTLGIVSGPSLEKAFADYPEGHALQETDDLADFLEQIGLLTPYQARALRENRLAELVMDNYLILDRLGQGGMGMVFRAIHKRMKRIVAIKVLNQETQHNQDNLARFQREVETIARLNHPGVMHAYDADTGPLGFFLVLEFVEGNDLDKWVRKKGPMGAREAADAIIQAAEGLQYVHDQGMVHRDIKPPNLMRTRSGQIKIADLGLVRMAGASDPNANAMELTKEFTIAGTLEYMAPEQAEDTHNVDCRVDIYSLGCSLYFLLTGKEIYPAKSVIDKIMAHRLNPIPSLTALRGDVPFELDVIFQKMVAKDPSHRFQTMKEVAIVLRNLLPQLIEVKGDAEVPTGPFTVPTTSNANVDTSATMELNAPSTIILVEPSRAQGIVIASQIKKLGFPVVQICGTAKEALEKISQASCHAILSSMHLPDLQGMDLLNQVREKVGDNPLRILLTTEVTPALTADAAMAGVKLLKKPFAPEALKPVLAPVSTSVKTITIKSPSAPGSVLLVDDSPSARRRMGQTLAKIGFPPPTEANNGLEGFEIAKSKKFDMIITDFHMPKMDGKELVEKLKANPILDSTPIFLITSDTESFLLDPIRNLKGVKILAKSLTSAELEKEIAKCWPASRI